MSGRIRTLKPEWLDDELLASEADHVRLLSVALMLMADDHGRGRASVQFVAGEAWRYDRSPEAVEKARTALDALERIGFICRYVTNGQSYFEIVNWAKHQRIQHVGKARVPAPPEKLSKYEQVESALETLTTIPETLTTNIKSLTPDLRSPITDHRPPLAATSAAAASVTASEKPVRVRKPKADAPVKETHPRYRDVVKAYFVAFESFRGSKPVFADRDGKHVNELLAKCDGDADRAIGIVQAAYGGDPFQAKGATIATIAANPSRYIGTGSDRYSVGSPQPELFDEAHRKAVGQRMVQESIDAMAKLAVSE